MSESTNSFAGLKDMTGVVAAETAAPKREPKRDHGQWQKGAGVFRPPGAAHADHPALPRR
jgi:hypothetical protein